MKQTTCYKKKKYIYNKPFCICLPLMWGMLTQMLIGIISYFLARNWTESTCYNVLRYTHLLRVALVRNASRTDWLWFTTVKA